MTDILSVQYQEITHKIINVVYTNEDRLNEIIRNSEGLGYSYLGLESTGNNTMALAFSRIELREGYNGSTLQ